MTEDVTADLAMCEFLHLGVVLVYGEIICMFTKPYQRNNPNKLSRNAKD